MRIHDTSNLGLVGDALCALPYILSQRPDALGAGLNRWVYAGLHLHDLPPLLPSPAEAPATVTLSQVFSHCHGAGNGLHMAQGWFALNNLPVPELPLELPFKQVIGPGLLQKYVLISPFSRTDHQNNKLWPLDRWVEFIKKLNLPVVIIGTSSDEGWHYLTLPNTALVKDKPLSVIVSLLRQALCTVTVDNGISHLCHFSGVENHVLLKPACLAPNFVHNPRSLYSIHANPLDVGVNDMLDLTHRCLAQYDCL